MKEIFVKFRLLRDTWQIYPKKNRISSQQNIIQEMVLKKHFLVKKLFRAQLVVIYVFQNVDQTKTALLKK